MTELLSNRYYVVSVNDIDDNAITLSVEKRLSRLAADNYTKPVVRMGYYGSHISCGVHEMNGFPNNDSMAVLTNAIDSIARTSGGDAAEMLKETISTYLRKYPQVLYSLLSDNNNATKSAFHAVLDDICEVVSEWKVNPNSSNPIKVWGFLHTEGGANEEETGECGDGCGCEEDACDPGPDF